MFIALLNKFSVASRAIDEILFGFYLSALPTIIVVFVMNKYLHTLDESFKAVEKFEQGIIYLGKKIYRGNAKSSNGQ